MTLTGFIARSAFRSKRRALLTILSVAVSLFLLVTLLVALRELTVPPEDVGASLRIAVRNRVSLAVHLPIRQRPVIAGIPGVRAVTPFSWFGGQFQNEEGTAFAQFGVDPAVFPIIFPDLNIPPEDLAAWQASRTSCIVGRSTAERHNLARGDRFTLRGSIWPCDLELTVAGIYDSSIDPTTLFFHHAYMAEASGATGEVGTWWVLAESAAVVPDVIRSINETFANTSSEVRAETESAFRLGFVSMLGDITLFIGSICAVVVFTLGLVTASTMSMAVRERFRELAILKALGFRTFHISALILAESFLLAAAGGLLGIGSAVLLFNHPLILSAMSQVFPVFELNLRIVAQAGLVSVILAIVAWIGPALTVAKLSVIDGLRTLD